MIKNQYLGTQAIKRNYCYYICLKIIHVYLILPNVIVSSISSVHLNQFMVSDKIKYLTNVKDKRIKYDLLWFYDKR